MSLGTTLFGDSTFGPFLNFSQIIEKNSRRSRVMDVIEDRARRKGQKVKCRGSIEFAEVELTEMRDGARSCQADVARQI